jgi:pyruvate dehydrogenase E1 component
MLSRLSPHAGLVTVQDGHPASLSWIGSASGRRVYPLGVAGFGQSGDLPDLYRTYGIDAEAIIDMAASACVDAARAG